MKNYTYQNTVLKKESKTLADKYILFYNEQRPHAKNGYKKTVNKETDYSSIKHGCSKLKLGNKVEIAISGLINS